MTMTGPEVNAWVDGVARSALLCRHSAQALKGEPSPSWARLGGPSWEIEPFTTGLEASLQADG